MRNEVYGYKVTLEDGVTTCNIKLAQELIERIRADAFDDFVEEMRKYWGGLSAMKEIEAVAKELKGMINES